MQIETAFGTNYVKYEDVVGLRAENAELKELLKLAVEDMRHNNDMSLPCNVCLNSVKFTGKPCPHKICEFKWRHSDRFNKILGGETE